MAQDVGSVNFKVKGRGEQLVLQVRADGVNFQELQQFAAATPPGFLRLEEAKDDRFSFVGPAGVPLAEWLQQPVSRFEFFYVIAQIADAVLAVRRNDLFLRSLLLNPNQIFINRNTREMVFLYLPLFANRTPPDMRGLMATIASLLHDDFAARFLSFVQGIELCDADAVMAFVAREEPDLVKQLALRSGVTYDVPALSPTQFQSAPNVPNIKDVPGIQNVHDVSDPQNIPNVPDPVAKQASPVLQAQPPAESAEPAEPVPVDFGALLRVSTGEVIPIRKASFRIGREQSTADYIVSDNSAVSRNHADVVARDQSRYIMDLGSRNRTFLNGQPIPPHVETELHDGDQVRLGDEDFIFRA